MQRAPEWTANLGVQYTVPIAVGSILLSGNYYYTSKFPFDPAGEYFQDAYNLVNLRAAWTDAEERWQVAIFGTNVFDEEYNSQVLPGQPAIQRTYGEPAVVGVSVGFKY
jgi:iron complex outermembrane receptor protein